MSELSNSIKQLVLGTKSSEIDKDIDQSFKSIEAHSLSSSKNKYVETIKSLIKGTDVSTSIPNDLVKDIPGIAQVENFDQTGRISRYTEYDAIVNKISYCQRALETLTDHIISPDDITKTSVQYIKEPEFEKSDIAISAISKLKDIEKRIKLESKIRSMVRTTLHKGDNFVEIIISPKGQNMLTVIQESSQAYLNIDNNRILQLCKEEISYKITKDKEEETVKKNVIIEFTPIGGVLGGMGGQLTSPSMSLPFKTYQSGMREPLSKDTHPTEKVDDEEFQAKHQDPNSGQDIVDKRIQLSDIYCVIHNPKHVIRLETERFKTCLGYLVFPKVDPRITFGNQGLSSNLNNVDSLCNNIINKLYTSLQQKNDSITITDDMKKSIMAHLASIKNNEDLKIRYVPSDLMIHWRHNIERYDPYGESIFEAVNFDCRLLMALKTATTIKRLSYASDKRVISVETGLPRDAKNIIEGIKEGLNKRKLSVQNMGSIDTIPSQVQTFETIYVPMRDGKKFIEFDKMEWGQNPQDDIEPLKFIRDNIVANLGVPAPYLGLEENVSNRSLLTTENINFCRTIIAYQKNLSVYLKEIFEKIYKLIYKKPEDVNILDHISITFQEPKISPYEHQMEYVEQMQRLIEALKQLGVPMEWLKKKYLPNFDWDEIDKMKSQQNLDKETSEEQPDQLNGMMPPGGMY